ncbi:MAG TPA: hypothetical protein VMI74_05995 [Burkholderiales bacterium]|nr:hypothetical protein [Burkholderiales bacterium]
MKVRNISKLAVAAVFLSSAAVAGSGVQLTPASEIFQYGDSMYTWDPESGGAVRVGAIWDGFMPGKDMLFQQGDFVYRRSAVTGEAEKVGAVWDGHVAGSSAVASGRSAGTTLAYER